MLYRYWALGLGIWETYEFVVCMKSFPIFIIGTLFPSSILQ